MTKIEFYELFLREFQGFEEQEQELRDKLRQGRSLYIISQQLGEVEIRRNEAERLFEVLRKWF